jgi:MerR family transcriptional regulator, light-induced transcriptional regulator
MAGVSQFGPAPDSSAAAAASVPLPLRDPVALRAAVDAAIAEGRPAGAVYAQIVRPWLALYADAGGGGPVADTHRRMARSTAQAALAGLAAAHPTSAEGLDRRAAVLEPPGPLGELDARLLADVLEAAGWSVTLVGLAAQPEAVVATVDAHEAELVVLPAADAAQVLAAQRACQLLRRANHPPLIVGVAFDADREPVALGADHFVGTANALAPLVRRRLGGHGGTPWGVRLDREGRELVVAPLGVLDGASVVRLREIVESRRTLYPRIVIDLRELRRADAHGLGALVAWDAELPWDPTVAAVGDERALTGLRDAGLEGRLPLA